MIFSERMFYKRTAKKKDYTQNRKKTRERVFLSVFREPASKSTDKERARAKAEPPQRKQGKQAHTDEQGRSGSEAIIQNAAFCLTARSENFGAGKLH